MSIRNFIRLIVVTACGALCLAASAQKFENVALIPQMGWNSWNKFQTHINETLVHQIADAMATNGMKKAGFRYINLDDGWQGERDANGDIQPDPIRFSSGMKALADYVHSKGLKLGVYSDVGNKTCAGYAGSRDHEEQDAKMYASWGVDYLKYDWCNHEGLIASNAYAKMSQALHDAGRPILFSLCEWGDNQPWLWAKDIGHSWRTTGDICAVFDGIIQHGDWHQSGVLQILDQQNALRTYAGPGHWNDPDMLEVGNGSLTPSENRAHFTMWCMLAAPLISGNDLRHMSKNTLDVLTAKDIIALDQDKLGIEAFRYSANDGVEVWFKPLTHGRWGMVVLNRNTTPHNFTFDWKNEKVSDDFSHRDAKFDSKTYKIKNLWTKEKLGKTNKPLETEIPAHDVLALRLY